MPYQVTLFIHKFIHCQDVQKATVLQQIDDFGKMRCVLGWKAMSRF